MTTSNEYFDRRSDGWTDLYRKDPQFRRRYRYLTQLVEEAFKAEPPGVALDAGCGSGVFSVFMAERGWQVTAVDSSRKMLMAAEQLAQARLGHTRNIEFRCMSIEDLDLRPASVDLVICLSALEYVEHDLVALEKLALALRPGGCLVLSVPNRGSLVRRVEAIVRRLRRSAEADYLRVQRHQYRPHELDDTLGGLGVVKQRHIYWSAGFSRPQALLPFFETAWWAAMYGGAYRKVTAAS